MNISADWMSMADAVGAWLSTYLLHSTALLVPALMLNRWLGARQLPLQESVLRVALIGGLLTASLQSGLGVQAATGSIPYPASSSRARVEAIEKTAGPVMVAIEMEASTALPSASGAGSEARRRSATVPAAGVAPQIRSWRSLAAAIPWLGVAVAVWLTGALLLVIRLGVLAWRLSTALRDRQEIQDGGVFRIFWRLLASADIDRPTALTRTRCLEVPIALGLGRREVCLPQRVAAEMPADQQETVLAHELAHLERHDPIWLLAARILESALFIQPLNRIARCRLQEIAEYRCDDWAAQHTGRPLTLARCLTEVATWSHAKRVGSLAPTMAGRRSGLGRRVRRLLDPGYSSLEVRLPSWWRPLAVVALALVLVAVPGFSIVERQEESQAEESAENDRSVAEPKSSEQDGRAPALAEATASPEAAAAPRADSAPVVGAEGIVGPTDDFDASDPMIAAVPVASPRPVARAGAAPEVAVPALAPVVEVNVAHHESVKVVRHESVEARVAVAVAPRVVVRVAPQLAYTWRVPVDMGSSGHLSDSGADGIEAAPQVDEHSAEHDDASRSQHDGEESRSHDDDWDGDDWDDDDWEGDFEDELEDELDALEDEIDSIVDELEETFEAELEPVLEALEDEMDEIEEMLEETIENELEMFEEELDRDVEAFEDELEILEDRMDERFERSGSDRDEERFENDLERIEDEVDRLYDRIDDQMDRIEDRLESRLERDWERDYERRLEPRYEEMERRIEAESYRLERMAYEILARVHDRGELTAEDRELLLEEARRAAESARPSAEEIESLRVELDQVRTSAMPSAEELEAMRLELRSQLEELRAQAQQGLAEQREALEALSQKHQIR